MKIDRPPLGRKPLPPDPKLLSYNHPSVIEMVHRGGAERMAAVCRIRYVPWGKPLLAIASGSRDRMRAEHLDFDYEMAAELLLLIETLDTNASTPDVAH